MTYAVFYIITCVMTIILGLTMARKTEIMEVCNMETFEANCAKNEVIVIDTAMYGRMRAGNCANMGYGSIGCGVDVIAILDSKCSGKGSCQVRMPDPAVYAMNKCPSQLVSYLAASYSCIPVIEDIRLRCHNEGLMVLTASEGHLVNSHDSARCNWEIRLGAGLRINLTLFDFGAVYQQRLSLSDNSLRVKGNQKYAIVTELESQKQFLVYGGASRIRNVYESDSNAIEVITMPVVASDDMGHTADVTYVLQYEAIGCLDPDIPLNALLSRDSNNAVVSCGNTTIKHYLVCKNRKWIGELPVCPEKSSHLDDDMGMWATLTSDWKYGVLATLGLGVALGVIIGVGLLFAVLLYCKRKEKRATRFIEEKSYIEEPNYQTSDIKVFYERSMCDSSTLKSHLPYTSAVLKSTTNHHGSDRSAELICTCPQSKRIDRLGQSSDTTMSKKDPKQSGSQVQQTKSYMFFEPACESNS